MFLFEELRIEAGILSQTCAGFALRKLLEFEHN